MSKRQNVYAAENWKVIYQAFSNVSLTAYDYHSIYNALVEYIKINNPDEFNNYITHTELMTHVNMLAYLGQSLAFRIDLNARENFFDTAERRDSILKLAYALSYNSKRNRAAHGVVKITSISTNQPILDNTGNSLAGREVVWNAPNDLSWYDNFIRILNSSISSVNRFGNPLKTQTIDNVLTDLYPLNTKTGSAAKLAYPFSANVNGKSYEFELVSSYIERSGLVEASPSPNTLFNIMYRNDNNGVGSPNTGFFVQFKQGKLEHSDFNYSKPKKDRQELINTENINDTDVWVQQIRPDGSVIDEWVKVDSLVGESVTYNSISNNIRKIFSVKTEEDNKIKIVYSDGQFGDVPLGTFRTWYRVSENDNYIIRPNDIKNKSKTITYVGNDNQEYQLTIKFSLTYEVGNASKEETVDEIASNAPMLFYTQNRMVNGEDYNVFPQTQSNIVLKNKTVNRTYAGHSRFIKAHDPTGSISTINVFGSDGYIFKEERMNLNNITIDYNTNYSTIAYSHIEPLIENDFLQLFYYHNLRGVLLSNPMDNKGGLGEDYLTYPTQQYVWRTLPNQLFSTTGYFVNTSDGSVLKVGKAGNDKWSKFIRPNSVIKLGDGSGNVVWTTVKDVYDDGYVDINYNSRGSIALTSVVRDGWFIISIIPGLRKNILDKEAFDIHHTLENNRSFGLRYDFVEDQWKIIEHDNIINSTTFDLNEPNGPNANDNRWLVKGIITNDDGILKYDFQSRGTQFVFGSDTDVRFFFKNTNRIIDPDTGAVVNDYVSILQSNTDKVNRNNRKVNGRAFVGQFRTSSDHTPLSEYDITMVVGSNFGNIKLYDINGDEISTFHIKEVNGKQMLSLDAPRNASIRISNIIEVYNSDNAKKSLDRPYSFSLKDSYVKSNGEIDPSKVVVVPEDRNFDGIPDYPLAFDDIVESDSYIFFKETSTEDGLVYESVVSDIEILNNNSNNIIKNKIYYCVRNVALLDYDNSLVEYVAGNFYMGVPDEDGIRMNRAELLEGDTALYRAKKGRSFNNDEPLYFEWKHYASTDERINPAITNLMSSYILTREYDNQVRSWMRNNGHIEDFPAPPSSNLIRNMLLSVEDYKTISDQIIYIPANYKLLFGSNAPIEYQASFKVIRSPSTMITDNEIKSNIINAINSFFEIDKWEFGEGFYFSDLSTYIHNAMKGSISSIVIVPKNPNGRFGDLYEVTPRPNELFLSTAKVEDVEIVRSYTDYNLRKK